MKLTNRQIYQCEMLRFRYLICDDKVLRMINAFHEISWDGIRSEPLDIAEHIQFLKDEGMLMDLWHKETWFWWNSGMRKSA